MSDDNELTRLQEQLVKTKALYDNAKVAHHLALQRMYDLGMTHPDGSILHAVSILSHTLNNYMTALLTYNRFVLDQSQLSLNPFSGAEKARAALADHYPRELAARDAQES